MRFSDTLDFGTGFSSAWLGGLEVFEKAASKKGETDSRLLFFLDFWPPVSLGGVLLPL